MYFNLFQSGNNLQWYFTLTAANHQPVAQSEGYKAKVDALHAINLIRATANGAPIFDQSAKRWAS